VAVLENYTVYTHQSLLDKQLFIFVLGPPFFLGTVSGSFYFMLAKSMFGGMPCGNLANIFNLS